MVYTALKGGRGETINCAIVCAMKGGSGVPKHRVGAQRIVLIRAQEPRNKTISCIGQAWPLHDIGITNIVWCMAYKRGVGGGGRILRNGRAIVVHQGGQCR